MLSIHPKKIIYFGIHPVILDEIFDSLKWHFHRGSFFRNCIAAYSKVERITFMTTTLKVNNLQHLIRVTSHPLEAVPHFYRNDLQ